MTRIIRATAILALVLFSLSACMDAATPTPAGGARLSPPTTTTAGTGATCHANGALPDFHCTPGATNPAVTQETIKTTICVVGWTATIRPPVSVTGPIKTERMAAYGYAARPQSDAELDHLISLELGGAPADVRNLWPELYAPTPGAHEKDKVENYFKAQVCNGSMTLALAQQEIVQDWTKVYDNLAKSGLLPVEAPGPGAPTATPVE